MMEADQLHPRVLAHLGDGVYELHVRQKAVAYCMAQHNQPQHGQQHSDQSKALHRYTTDRVNAGFQAGLLALLTPHLTEIEADWVRRSRNMPVPVSRRANQAVYRQATGFETLIGYLFLTDTDRLCHIWQLVDPSLEIIPTDLLP